MGMLDKFMEKARDPATQAKAKAAAQKAMANRKKRSRHGHGHGDEHAEEEYVEDDGDFGDDEGDSE